MVISQVTPKLRRLKGVGASQVAGPHSSPGSFPLFLAAPTHRDSELPWLRVVYVCAQSSEPLWAAQDDATLATASIAVGTHEAKTSQPMAVSAETGALPFSLTKVILLEPGLTAAQQLLDSVVKVTFANASAVDAKTQAPLPVTVGTATLDLLPLLSGAVACGGEVAVAMVAAEAQAATEPGQVRDTLCG